MDAVEGRKGEGSMQAWGSQKLIPVTITQSFIKKLQTSLSSYCFIDIAAFGFLKENIIVVPPQLSVLLTPWKLPCLHMKRINP